MYEFIYKYRYIYTYISILYKYTYFRLTARRAGVPLHIENPCREIRPP